MKRHRNIWSLLLVCFVSMVLAGSLLAASPSPKEAPTFPPSLDSYNDSDVQSILAILKNRAVQVPFNLVATIIFFCAIIHTFLTGRFMTIAHKWEHDHEEKKRQGQVEKHSVHHGAELFHFLGEVEAVFGLWAIALAAAIFFFHDWNTLINYLVYKVNFVEAEFVVVIMTLAATRPILKLSETIMWKIASLLGGSLTGWWFTILTFGPIFGSLITEPAAMTL